MKLSLQSTNTKDVKNNQGKMKYYFVINILLFSKRSCYNCNLRFQISQKRSEHFFFFFLWKTFSKGTAWFMSWKRFAGRFFLQMPCTNIYSTWGLQCKWYFFFFFFLLNVVRGGSRWIQSQSLWQSYKVIFFLKGPYMRSRLRPSKSSSSQSCNSVQIFNTNKNPHTCN